MSVTLHTSLGPLKLELECERVPRLTENFLALAASGAYDGTLFHRNIAGFLVQGGDPTGTGKGGDALLPPPPGAAGSGVAVGKLPNEPHPALVHDRRGVVAMANSGPGTNGAQFYMTYGAQRSLDGVYSVIGAVVGGSATLDAMERVPVAGKKHRPTVDIVLHAVTVHANPFAA